MGVRACVRGRTFLRVCVGLYGILGISAFPLFAIPHYAYNAQKVPRARTVGRFRRRLGVPVKVHALLFPTTPQRPCTSLVELRIMRVARLICALVGDGS